MDVEDQQTQTKHLFVCRLSDVINKKSVVYSCVVLDFWMNPKYSRRQFPELDRKALGQNRGLGI